MDILSVDQVSYTECKPKISWYWWTAASKSKAWFVLLFRVPISWLTPDTNKNVQHERTMLLLWSVFAIDLFGLRACVCVCVCVWLFIGIKQTVMIFFFRDDIDHGRFVCVETLWIQYINVYLCGGSNKCAQPSSSMYRMRSFMSLKNDVVMMVVVVKRLLLFQTLGHTSFI